MTCGFKTCHNDVLIRHNKGSKGEEEKKENKRRKGKKKKHE
jgi:hypothetical protein